MKPKPVTVEDLLQGDDAFHIILGFDDDDDDDPEAEPTYPWFIRPLGPGEWGALERPE